MRNKFLSFSMIAIFLGSNANALQLETDEKSPVQTACDYLSKGPLDALGCRRQAAIDQQSGLTEMQVGLKICAEVRDAKQSRECTSLLTQGPLATKKAVFLDFTNKQLKNLDLSGGQLNAVYFTGADLSSANFSKSSVKVTDFVGANLAGAKFDGADIQGIDFRNANLRNVSFKNVTWSVGQLYQVYYRVTFKGADLRGVDFTGSRNSPANVGLYTDADERFADLVRAQWEGEVFDKTTKLPFDENFAVINAGMIKK